MNLIISSRKTICYHFLLKRCRIPIQPILQGCSKTSAGLSVSIEACVVIAPGLSPLSTRGGFPTTVPVPSFCHYTHLKIIYFILYLCVNLFAFFVKYIRDTLFCMGFIMHMMSLRKFHLESHFKILNLSDVQLYHKT